MMDLVFSSDNLAELNEQRADGVIKVDFVDQVIAGELIENVFNWYEGLQNIPEEEGLQKFFEKRQGLIVSLIHNFTPIILLLVYHFYFNTFCKWSNYTDNMTLSNIQLLFISFITVFFIGSMLGKKFARWVDNKIDNYESYKQFDITKGDKNSLVASKSKNESISKSLIYKGAWAVFTAVIAFFVKYLLENFVK